MANLTEQTQWEDGVYQWEETDEVRGGENGVDNVPTKQLANRTNYLKRQMDEVIQAAGLTPDPAVLDQLAQAIQQLGGAGIGLGTAFWHMGEAPPVGAMEFGGQLLNRTLYADLWNEINKTENNITLVSDADWTAGRTGCWSAGDGATTFRAPLVLGDFLRVFDSSGLVDIGRVLGSFQDQDTRFYKAQSNGSNANNYYSGGPYDGAFAGKDVASSHHYRDRTIYNWDETHNTHPRNTAWMLCFRYE